MKKFVDTTNSQSRPTGHYSGVIAQIAEDGVCPFCPENLSKYHKPQVEERTYWLITDNMYPYKPSLHHRLIVHKAHITHLNELSLESWVELLSIIKEEIARLSINGGSFIARFGDTHYTGASVSHLHAHIVQSDPSDPAYDSAKGLTMRVG